MFFITRLFPIIWPSGSHMDKKFFCFLVISPIRFIFDQSFSQKIQQAGACFLKMTH